MSNILNIFKKVKSEYKESYLQLFHECQRESLKEEACIDYTLYQSLTDANTFMLFEQWSNREGLLAHTQTPHFKDFIESTKDFFEESKRIDSETV